MASVVREAGVGIATVFRHFPTETEPVDAVFIGRRDAYTAAVTAALKRNYGDGGASMGSTGKGRKRRADSTHGADAPSRSCTSRQVDVTSDAECMSNASLSRHPQRRGTA